MRKTPQLTNYYALSITQRRESARPPKCTKRIKKLHEIKRTAALLNLKAINFSREQYMMYHSHVHTLMMHYIRAEHQRAQNEEERAKPGMKHTKAIVACTLSGADRAVVLIIAEV